MKKRYRFPSLVLALGLVLGLAMAPRVNAQGLGFTLGLNYNELSEIETGDANATFENASGWHVGLWYDLVMGPLALRPGVRYMDAGQLFEDFEFEGGAQSVNYSVTLVEVPIDVRLRLPMPFIAPYVLAGPVLRFSAGEEGEEQVARSFSMAGGVGAGVELNLAGLRLFPEVKYTFGLSRFTEEGVTVGGIEFPPDESQELNALMLSVGLGL